MTINYMYYSKGLAWQQYCHSERSEESQYFSPDNNDN